MKKIRLRFEPDPTLDHIEIVIRASEQDGEVTALMDQLSGAERGRLTVYCSRAGSPAAATALSLLVMGLFGVLCFCGTLFYEIERWPLAAATAAHYLSITLGYLITNRLLCWNMPLKLLLMIEGMMTLGFFLIWLFMYLHFKAEVRKLNELAKLRNETGESGLTDKTDGSV